jgi:hypothetical protein
MPYGDDDATATMPPSVMAGGPAAAEQPLGMGFEAQPGVTPFDTPDAVVRPREDDPPEARGLTAVQDRVAYEKNFTPQQQQQITTLNNQRATVAQAYADGKIRRDDYRDSIMRLNAQAQNIRPQLIPKVKPPSMQEMVAQHTYTDDKGNTWFRNPDGTMDMRPPSPHSPQAKLFDAQHEASMAHGDEVGTAAQQFREHQQQLKEAALSQSSDLALLPHEQAMGRLKVEQELAKNNALAHKQQNDFQTAQAKKLADEQKATEAKHSGYLDKARKDLQAEAKAEAEAAAAKAYQAGKADSPKAATIPEIDDEKVIARAHRLQDLDERYLQERRAKQQPTLAPAQAAEPASPTMPARQQLQHPNVRPDAPQPIHQARQQLDDWAVQYGGDPSKWPKAILEQARAIKQQVLPYRQ